MKNISSNFIMIFSGVLAFIAGLLYATNTNVANLNFEATINKLFVPAIVCYIAIVAVVKFKQSREGLSL